MEQTCTACHSSFPVNSGKGKLTIEGLPNIYYPNQEITLTVRLRDQNAKLFGFQMTALDSAGRQAGVFILPPRRPLPVQIIAATVGDLSRSYIEHTAEGIVPDQVGEKSWTFVWRAPQARLGQIRFFAAANAADGGGDTRADYIYAVSETIHNGAAKADFDGDAKADISVFRPDNGSWYYKESSGGNFSVIPFGVSGDLPVSADFDGDGKADLAVFRPAAGIWYVLESKNQTFRAYRWGQNGDVPTAADFSGDGRADLAVFRPESGIWYILQNSGAAYTIISFGQTGDLPLSGNFDADAVSDIAVYRDGIWFILKSRDNSITINRFGLKGDQPLPADYDGDGLSDLAVFRPSSAVWYFLGSQSGFGAYQFGLGTDKPVPTDYDGDGRTDAAVYRNGAWFIKESGSSTVRYETFGLGTDRPVAAR